MKKTRQKKDESTGAVKLLTDKELDDLANEHDFLDGEIRDEDDGGEEGETNITASLGRRF